MTIIDGIDLLEGFRLLGMISVSKLTGFSGLPMLMREVYCVFALHSKSQLEQIQYFAILACHSHCCDQNLC